MTITSAADNGCYVKATRINAMLHCKEHNLIRRDRKGVTISTGNGKLYVDHNACKTVPSKNRK